jgi:hypothetical protein
MAYRARRHSGQQLPNQRTNIGLSPYEVSQTPHLVPTGSTLQNDSLTPLLNLAIPPISHEARLEHISPEALAHRYEY